MIFAAAFFGLVQMLVGLVLIVKAVRWTKKHPLGADPGDEFFGLLFGDLFIGALFTLSLLMLIGLPSLHALLGADPASRQASLMQLTAGLLALSPLLPALGLRRRIASKANVVALLAAAGMLPGLGIMLLLASAVYFG